MNIRTKICSKRIQTEAYLDVRHVKNGNRRQNDKYNVTCARKIERYVERKFTNKSDLLFINAKSFLS